MCAVGGLSSSSSTLSGLVRPIVSSCSLPTAAWNALEVVDPPLGDDVGAARARLPVGDQRDLGRLLDRRVLGAVDEAGQVAAVAVHEARLLDRERRDRREHHGDAARDVEREVLAGAVDPDPDVVLGRRARDGRRPRWRRTAASSAGASSGRSRRHSVGAEADDEVEAARGDGRLAQPRDRGDDVRRRSRRPQVELEVVVRSSSLGEDPRLAGAIASVLLAQLGRPRTPRSAGTST